MRVLTLFSAVAILAAGCSAERLVNSGEFPAAPPVSTSTGPPLPPLNSANLVDAFDYVAHPQGRAVYFFTTPSGRWACAIVPRDKAGCQAATDWQSGLGITDAPETVPDPLGEETTPTAVVVEREGEPRFVATDQPEFIEESANVLEFNRVLAVANFRCNVQESGVSCLSETSGMGFSFAPEGFVPRYTEVPAGAP